MAISPAVKAARPGFTDTVMACVPDAVPSFVKIFTMAAWLKDIFV